MKNIITAAIAIMIAIPATAMAWDYNAARIIIVPVDIGDAKPTITVDDISEKLEDDFRVVYKKFVEVKSLDNAISDNHADIMIIQYLNGDSVSVAAVNEDNEVIGRAHSIDEIGSLKKKISKYFDIVRNTKYLDEHGPYKGQVVWGD